jgi:hypothetical protein
MCAGGTTGRRQLANRIRQRLRPFVERVGGLGLDVGQLLGVYALVNQRLGLLDPLRLGVGDTLRQGLIEEGEHDKVWGAPNAGSYIPAEVTCVAPHFVMLPQANWCNPRRNQPPLRANSRYF